MLSSYKLSSFPAGQSIIGGDLHCPLQSGHFPRHPTKMRRLKSTPKSLDLTTPRLNPELGYALESPKPLVRASGFPCVTGNQFGRYGIEYQRLLDEAIEEFPP